MRPTEARSMTLVKKILKDVHCMTMLGRHYDCRLVYGISDEDSYRKAVEPLLLCYAFRLDRNRMCQLATYC